MLICQSCAHRIDHLPGVTEQTMVCPLCGFDALTDAPDEIPVLQPITVRPVELNADLWKEWNK